MIKLKDRKNGFTLIELLVTIAILSLIIVVVAIGIVNVIKNSKENSGKVTEKGIKEAANIYAIEADSDKWHIIDSDGINTKYDYFCVTIGELVKKGLLEHDKVINSKFKLNEYIAVSRNSDTLTIEKEEFVNNDTIPLVRMLCTGNSEGAEGYKPDIEKGKIYSDEINIKVDIESLNKSIEAKGEKIESVSCLYNDNPSIINKIGTMSSDYSSCNIDNLKNKDEDGKIEYTVRICVDTKNIRGCTDLSTNLADINLPSINILNEVDNTKINITYPDNSNNLTKDENGNLELYQYFKSTVSGKVNKNVYECDSDLICDNLVTDIKENKYYKTVDNNVILDVTSESSSVDIEAKIVDKSDNESITEKQFNINKITFKKSNADTINSQSSDVLKKCISETGKSCKIVSPTIEKTGYQAIGWNKDSNATISSWDVNKTKEINENETYYPILIKSKIYVIYHVNGGIITEETEGGKWTIDSDGAIYKNGNLKFYSVAYGDTPNSSGLVNYNNSSYIHITREGYNVKKGEHWNTKSDGTGKSFSQVTEYSYDDLIEYTTFEDYYYRLDLYVNWTPKTYTINYYLGNGTSTAGVTSLGSTICVYDNECPLKEFSKFNKDFYYNSSNDTNYGWEFYGWSTSKTGKNANYTDNQTFIYKTANDLNLYAIGKKTFYFYGGIAPTKNYYKTVQYWNPYSTSSSYLTSIKFPEEYAIDGWSLEGFIGGSPADKFKVKYDYTYAGKDVTPAYSHYPYNRSVYKRNVYLNYKANGGIGSDVKKSASQYYNCGIKGTDAVISNASFTLESKSLFTPATEGYIISDWAEGSISGTKYKPGASYTNFNPAVNDKNTTKDMYAIWIDNQAPTCKISAKTTKWTNENVVLEIERVSDNSGEFATKPYSWNGGSYSTSETYTVSSNKKYVLKVKDAAGNDGECSYSVTNIDKIAPTITWNQKSSTTWCKNKYISATCSDGESGVVSAKMVDNNSPYTVTNDSGVASLSVGQTFSTTRSKGDINTYVTCVDKAGNSSTDDNSYIIKTLSYTCSKTGDNCPSDYIYYDKGVADGVTIYFCYKQNDWSCGTDWAYSGSSKTDCSKYNTTVGTFFKEKWENCTLKSGKTDINHTDYMYYCDCTYCTRTIDYTSKCKYGTRVGKTCSYSNSSDNCETGYTPTANCSS